MSGCLNELDVFLDQWMEMKGNFSLSPSDSDWAWLFSTDIIKLFDFNLIETQAAYWKNNLEWGTHAELIVQTYKLINGIYYTEKNIPFEDSGLFNRVKFLISSLKKESRKLKLDNPAKYWGVQFCIYSVWLHYLFENNYHLDLSMVKMFQNGVARKYSFNYYFSNGYDNGDGYSQLRNRKLGIINELSKSFRIDKFIFAKQDLMSFVFEQGDFNNFIKTYEFSVNEIELPLAYCKFIDYLVNNRLICINSRVYVNCYNVFRVFGNIAATSERDIKLDGCYLLNDESGKADYDMVGAMYDSYLNALERLYKDRGKFSEGYYGSLFSNRTSELCVYFSKLKLFYFKIGSGKSLAYYIGEEYLKGK